MDFLNMEAQKYWSFPASYSKEKRAQEFKTILNSGNYVASEKKDGYWEMVWKNAEGHTFLRARSKGVNGWICKEDWVPQMKEFFDSLPNETCLIGEVYLNGKTSKGVTSILGCGRDKAVQRQRDDEWLHYFVFDVLAYDGVDLMKKPITERIKHLDRLSGDYVETATYWDTPQEIEDNWLRILSDGGEGVVLTKKDSLYEPKKRTARKTLKLKKELADTIDVFLTGRWKEATRLYTGSEIDTWRYWVNDLTGELYEGLLSEKQNTNYLTPVTRLYFYNMAGAVEIATNILGKETPIGWISGIDDTVRKGIVEEPELYRGKVAELQAMEVDTTSRIPTLRHARILRWREDKLAEECVWSL